MTEPKKLKLAIPKGRMHDGVLRLMEEAGIPLRASARGYRPEVGLPDCEAKILKPQNVVEMLAAGSRDLGFAGADWVAELAADVVELLDTSLDPVRLVAAAPTALLQNGQLPQGPLVVASEYEQITRNWIERTGLDAQFVRSYGATEVFPPEDADVIVDNTATGSTLRANGLKILDDLMVSSTRLYASRSAMEDRQRRRRVEDVVLLVRSVLEARQRVMLEVNVPGHRLEEVCAALPCMREPTVSALAHEAGYAVKAAIPRSQLATVIPLIKERGGSDVVVTRLSQIVP